VDDSLAMPSQAVFVVRNKDGLCKKEDSPKGRLGRSIITDTEAIRARRMREQVRCIVQD
jgi:hypothetical protein